MTKSDFENGEDRKLEVLAQATLRRTGANQAAALRDSTGRTYVARNIDVLNLTLNAVEAVFTVAMASQIERIEAVVVVGEGLVNSNVIRTHSPSALLWFSNRDGEIEAL